MLLKSLLFTFGLCSLYFIRSVHEAPWWLLASLFGLLISLRLPSKLIISSFISTFLMGVIWASFSVVIWGNTTAKLIEKPVKVEIKGQICSIPSKQAHSLKFDFCLQSIDHKPLSWLSNNKVITSVGKYSELAEQTFVAGQVWQFRVKLLPIHAKANPNAFDFEQWMVANGYVGKASVKSGVLIEKPFLLISSRYHRLRQKAYNALINLFADKQQLAADSSAINQFGTSSLGTVLAITLGEKSHLNDEQWHLFRATGTSHLLAISGLHVGIAALWSFWLVSFLWRQSERLCLWLPANKAGQIASLIGALVLLAMSGFGLPAQRATLMLFLFVFFRWQFTIINLSRLLAYCLFAIGFMSPFSVLSISFWLSFIAVFIICCVINREYQPVSKFRSWLWVNGYLYVALTPITLMFFGLISFSAILANLVLIPFVSFVLTPLIYLASLINIASKTVAEVLVPAIDFLVNLMTQFQLMMASVEYSFWQVSVNEEVVFLMVLLVAVLLIPKQLISKMVLLPIGLLILSLWSNKSDESPLKIVVFDIGQGLAVYVQTLQGNLLFDTGWGDGSFNLVQTVILPYFQANQISQLDKLIISHGDLDHAGGVKTLIEAMTIKSVIVGEPLNDNWVSRHLTKNCHQHNAWQWGNVKLTFLPHIGHWIKQGNNASCVLSIALGNKKILLTGDIEKAAEQSLVSKGLDEHFIVVAPHHGSKTSSTKAFVESTKPKHVIFSTGFANQWQFPKKEVVQTYKKVGAHSWITHQHGAIIIRFNHHSEIEINGWRSLVSHFWSSTQ